MYQYHTIITEAIRRWGDEVFAFDNYGQAYEAEDLLKLATQATEYAYKSICCSGTPEPWYGYARIIKWRDAVSGGKWIKVITFEPSPRRFRHLLPTLTLYTG